MEDSQEKASTIRRVSLLFGQSSTSRMSVDLSRDEKEKPEDEKEEEKEEKPKKVKYTSVQWVTLATLAFGNFCIGACVSLQAPFFPQEAEKKGATPKEYGLIFGMYELTIFLVAPIMGKLVSMLPPKFIFNSGMFTVGVTVICFGLLDFVYGRNTFVGMAFVVRILEGIGAAAEMTSAFVIIASAFPNNVATTIALLATFIGIGLIVGPTVGGALFDAGGYGLPFYMMGSLMCLDALIILLVLPAPKEPENQGKRQLIKFWLHPVTWVYALSIFSGFNYIGFNAATLEPHLRQFNFSGSTLGLIFALSGTLYAVSAPFWGWLCDKKLDAKIITLMGCVIISASLLLIGPMPFLHIETKIGVVLVALALQGIGLGAKLVCSFAGCLKDTVARGFPPGFATSGLVSSMFASSNSLGAFVGPSIGGYLLEVVGYDYGTYVVLGFEFFVMLFLGTYAITSGVCSRKRDKLGDEEKRPILPEEKKPSTYS